jgi:alpha-N-arabinofuranosidase
VVVGNLLISLLRHNDRIGAACQAQLVNAIAPIRAEPTGPAWRQSTFHPFALTSRLAQGQVLQVNVQSPTYETAKYGTVKTLDAVATHDTDSGDLAVFVVNRDQASSAGLDVPLQAFGSGFTVLEAWTISDDDLTAVNTQDDPNRVEPRPTAVATVTDGTLHAELPPVSWTVIRLGSA